MSEPSKKHTINRIIFWLKQIRYYEKTLDFINEFMSDSTVTLKKETKLKMLFRNRRYEKEFTLDNTMSVEFYGFLQNKLTHLRGLIADADTELVEIAKAILDGKLNGDIY